jgi:hypothetical protein
MEYAFLCLVKFAIVLIAQLFALNGKEKWPKLNYQAQNATHGY